MKTIPGNSTLREESRAGFTLTELLVVMAVLAILACLLVSAQAGGKDQSRVAQCSNNLKQFAYALHIYGGENKDKLPVNTAGFWTWDMAWNTGNIITQWISFDRLYCPGTSVRFDDEANEGLWSYYAPGSIHVLGYLPTLPGTPSLIATNVNSTLIPQRIVSGPTTHPAPPPARRVLAADATISESPTDNHAGFVAGANYNFTTVAGGFGVPHISPHLNGNIPAGGNVAMLDGHVEWRKFFDMDQRATAGRGFWW